MSVEPNILPPSVQAAWDAWADARIRNIVLPIGDEIIDVIGEENGKIFERHARRLFDLVEIVAAVAADNPALTAKVDKLAEYFTFDGKPQRITRTNRRTINKSIEEEQPDVSQTLGIINQILSA